MLQIYSCPYYPHNYFNQPPFLTHESVVTAIANATAVTVTAVALTALTKIRIKFLPTELNYPASEPGDHLRTEQPGLESYLHP